MALFACVFPLLKSNSDPSLPSCLLLSKKKGVNKYFGFKKLKTRRLHTRIKAVMFSGNRVIGDLIATALSGGIALSVLRLWEETAKRGVFDQVGPLLFIFFIWKRPPTGSDTRSNYFPEVSKKKSFALKHIGLAWYESRPGRKAGLQALLRIKILKKSDPNPSPAQKTNRKLVHISIGLVFMLCWPMFSSGHQGAILAALIPGLNIIKMLLLGLGIWKDDATVKSMSRFGDHRELLKGPLYYALAITCACAVYWRYSPISIGLICNLCAGDGIADIVGRRFGKQKLPYNQNKSFAGSVAMATAGFLASIGYLHYFSLFGYIEVSSKTILGFLFVSLAAALVESHPLSSELDDNLTVPLISVLVGSLVI
ncbi:hypothetical protein RND71_021725 [Anisodus tanguticus]|uniref:Uncharacterized protein n=1 Tax=Anisodus tanguticus TaxID=243964 RepID=A0AAE1RYZ4_9SOLA|nr:hypothetical protein RND71_021725 [Anisodus tanguticus]